MLCYVISYHVVLCYVMICYVILCRIRETYCYYTGTLFFGDVTYSRNEGSKKEFRCWKTCNEKSPDEFTAREKSVKQAKKDITAYTKMPIPQLFGRFFSCW